MESYIRIINTAVFGEGLKRDGKIKIGDIFPLERLDGKGQFMIKVDGWHQTGFLGMDGELLDNMDMLVILHERRMLGRDK